MEEGDSKVIVALCLSFWPAPGGQSVRNTGILETLASSGYRVVVVCAQPAHARKAGLDKNLRIVSPTRPLTAVEKLLYLSCSIVRLARCYRDSIWLAETTTAAAILYPFSLLFGLKIVVDIHGLLCEELGLRTKALLRLCRILTSILLRNSEALVFASRRLQDHYKWISGVRSAVVPNCAFGDQVRVDKRVSLPFAEQGPEKKLKVCYIGGCHRWQGVKVMNEAFSRLLSTSQDVVLLLAIQGNEASTRWAISLENAYGDRVKVFKNVSHDEALDIANSSDIGILVRESNLVTDVAFPVKFSTYISQGVPIICTDVGEIGELTRKHGIGWIVEYSANGLVSTLKRLALSPEEVQQRRENCRILAPHITWEENTRDLANLLMELDPFLLRKSCHKEEA